MIWMFSVLSFTCLPRKEICHFTAAAGTILTADIIGREYHDIDSHKQINIERRMIMKKSSFQFLNPYLTELQFRTNPEFDGSGNHADIETFFKLHIKKSKEQNLANVELELNINMEKKKAPFEIIAKVAADFQWEDLDDKAVDAMLHLNAPALLLGYMRPIVANITNSSVFPVYNLPFMDFRSDLEQS